MGTGTKILVVDDEESLRDILSEVLTDAGHEVSVAANGNDAWAQFSSQPVPLVITDVRMPGMSGLQLLEKIKASHPDTLVIIITSHASLDSALTALRAGAYDYLIKPFEDLDLVTNVVNRAVDKLRLMLENRILVIKLQRYNQELEQVNEVLRDLAIRDSLTGLYNHRYFQEALAIEAARSHRHKRHFSLLFCDVDFFKVYNDTNGHPQGDALLRTLGQLLKSRIRGSDMAARYGGEEFVLLLPETTKENACIVAEDIRTQVEQYPFAGRATQPQGAVTLSVGVATFPEDGNDPQSIIQQADEVLYRAKRGGRNRVCRAGDSNA